jgi:hypothetical protein
MSWSGFNSGLYEQIRRYAEMTDQALVELKDETAHPGHENRQRLGKLLSEMDTMRREDLSARLIWLILRDSVKMSEQEIAGLGTALLSTGRHESITNSLEKLAQALAQEQAVVKSRMRSGVR